LYKLQRFWLFRGSGSSEDGRVQMLKSSEVERFRGWEHQNF
ncbi:hypothetical protein A2U01_0116535, partial [Trifolium medium]|nr:hypothetical protein [Trifolium medium]